MERKPCPICGRQLDRSDDHWAIVPEPNETEFKRACRSHGDRKSVVRAIRAKRKQERGEQIDDADQAALAKLDHGGVKRWDW